MSMDLRRWARPGRKTGDIPPDRTETRPKPEGRSPMARSPEVRPKPEVNTVWPYGNPKPETRPVLRRAGDGPHSAQVTDRSQSETAAALTLTWGDRNRVPSIWITTIAFLDVVEVARSPGTATEQTGCNYGEN